MADMCVPPPNQCFADGSDGAEEPLESSYDPAGPASVQPGAASSGTDGAEGAGNIGNAGSDELVRRFASDGSGGAPGMPGAPEHEGKSCLADDLKALSSCGNLIVNAAPKGGVDLLIAGIGCAGALVSVLGCNLGADDVSGR